MKFKYLRRALGAIVASVMVFAMVPAMAAANEPEQIDTAGSEGAGLKGGLADLRDAKSQETYDYTMKSVSINIGGITESEYLYWPSNYTWEWTVEEDGSPEDMIECSTSRVFRDSDMSYELYKSKVTDWDYSPNPGVYYYFSVQWNPKKSEGKKVDFSKVTLENCLGTLTGYTLEPLNIETVEESDDYYEGLKVTFRAKRDVNCKYTLIDPYLKLVGVREEIAGDPSYGYRVTTAKGGPTGSWEGETPPSYLIDGNNNAQGIPDDLLFGTLSNIYTDPNLNKMLTSEPVENGKYYFYFDWENRYEGQYDVDYTNIELDDCKIYIDGYIAKPYRIMASNSPRAGITVYIELTKLTDETVYHLFVEGKRVTSNNCVGSGWAYDKDTNTLILSNFGYSGTGQIAGTDVCAGIYATDDLNIKLIADNNTITMKTPDSTESEALSAAIYVKGDLTITGDGSLTATGANVESTDMSSYGIRADKNVTIDNVNVTANAGEADELSCGLYAGNGIEINGEVTAYGANTGIQTDRGNITISGEDTVVDTLASEVVNNAKGIYAKNGEIKIELPLGITTPVGGKLSRDKDTVCAEGETEGAKKVVIKKLEEVGVFTITFDAKGGKANPESAETNKYGMLDELPIPTRSGYTFEGWYDEDGEEVTTETVFTENATIYAQWIKNSISGGGRSGSVSYILTYETNGGEKIKAESHKAGDNVTLDKTPVKDGYTFTGWYADKECTQKIVSITMNSSKTVYAGWRDGTQPVKPDVPDEEAPLMVIRIGNTKYQLNGKNMEMDSAPFIDENDRTMLPVRAVANALEISDADIAWDDNTKTASFTRPDGKVVSCTVGIKTIKIGDEEVEIDTAPVIRNDRIYLPMRALFNAFNVSDEHIIWDAAARTVTVAKEALDDIKGLEAEPVDEPAEEEPVAETPAEEVPAEETPAEEA
ncbi:MAG: InlB B-repeat-containing protein [Firmicutes bacterium]|nr:InlB B-repeat-containing protein [Bacillota bacterium]